MKMNVQEFESQLQPPPPPPPIHINILQKIMRWIFSIEFSKF
jgi:hypothetical protein